MIKVEVPILDLGSKVASVHKAFELNHLGFGWVISYITLGVNPKNDRGNCSASS
jgi:hypothetical protein